MYFKELLILCWMIKRMWSVDKVELYVIDECYGIGL